MDPDVASDSVESRIFCISENFENDIILMIGST